MIISTRMSELKTEDEGARALWRNEHCRMQKLLLKQCYTRASACYGSHQSPSPRGKLVTQQVCFEFETRFYRIVAQKGHIKARKQWDSRRLRMCFEKMSGNLKMRLVRCPAFATD